MRLMLSVVLLVLAAMTTVASDVVMVWDVDEGLLTDQGGVYNHFAGGDSSAQIHLVRDQHRGPGGRSMKIDYHRTLNGFCGVWLHLFDSEALLIERTYIDTTEYPYVSFFVRGEKGGENFIVQMADPEWIRKEDSRPAGPVSRFLPGGVKTEWQEVVVPVEAFGLRDTRAAGLTLNFHLEGEGTVYIDDICFKKTKDADVPLSDAPPAEAFERDLARAMWVWETEELLTDAGARAQFFAFCNQHDVNELFLQLLYRFENDMTADVTCVLNREKELRAFVRESNKRGIRIHALDGFPEYVLQEHHPRVLALVRAIMSYNENSTADEQFYGIHLDNEPYQLLGFESPLQERILREYLELNDKVMELLGDNEMVYGVDIPFWFDERSKEPEANCIVTYKGTKQDAAKHIIDIVDNIGIMDYRDFAGGADGMIRHAEGEMAYAAEKGKAIYLGVETFKYDPTRVSFIYEVPLRSWERRNKEKETLLLSSQVNGFKVRCIMGESAFYPGLAWPADMESPTEEFNAALETLYDTFGGPGNSAQLRMDRAAPRMMQVLRQNPQYDGMKQFFLMKSPNRVRVAGWTTTENMPDKVTFAGRTKQYLEDVLAEVTAHYATHPTLAGFAVHYYSTYAAMEDGNAEEK